MRKKLYREISIKINAISHCIESGNTEWEIKHSNDLRELESFLPCGSGFDSGCEILESSTDERIIIESSYHAMDENGFYCGWYDFRIEISPSLIFNFEIDLICDFPDNPELYGLDDYIIDVFDYHLNQEIEKINYQGEYKYVKETE